MVNVLWEVVRKTRHKHRGVNMYWDISCGRQTFITLQDTDYLQ